MSKIIPLDSNYFISDTELVSTTRHYDKAQNQQIQRANHELYSGQRRNLQRKSFQETELPVLKPMLQRKLTTNDLNNTRSIFLLFLPDSKFLQHWNSLVALLLLYTATVMTFTMAFIEIEPWDTWFIIDFSTDCLFLIDVIINLNTCFINKNGVLIISRLQIFINYLKGWLIVDLIACIPFGFVDIANDNSSGDYNSLIRLIRLPRLYKLLRISRVIKMFKHYKNSKFLDRIQEFFSIKHSEMRLIASLLSIVLFIHIVSCFWYFASRVEGFNPDTWVVKANLQDEDIPTLYITSFYWAITTLSTVGYGDIVGFTVLERIIAMIWMIFGMIFFSFTISSLTQMMRNVDTKEHILTKRLQIIDEFAQENNLSGKLKFKLKFYLKNQTEKSGFTWMDKLNLFQQLPKNLRYEIAIAMHKGAAQLLSFFQNKDNVFISTIIPLLMTSFAIKGDIIYCSDENANEIYFITKGKVILSQKDSKKRFKTKFKGDHFGNVEVCKGIARYLTARAGSDSQLLVMNRKGIKTLRNEFSREWFRLNHYSEAEYQEDQKFLNKGTLKTEEPIQIVSSTKMDDKVLTILIEKIDNLTIAYHNLKHQYEKEQYGIELNPHLVPDSTPIYNQDKSVELQKSFTKASEEVIQKELNIEELDYPAINILPSCL